jgi:hypothetical protein
MKRIFAGLMLFFVGTATAFAQQPPELGGRSEMELYLSLGVLLFGLIILGLQVGLMFKVGKGWGPNSIRISGLTLVIISGLFLITAGYSQDQIAPMVGLLGTIAGYLLGKSEKQ